MTFKLDAGPKRRPTVRPLSSYRPKQCFEALRKDLMEDTSMKLEDDPFTANIKAEGIEFETVIGARLALNPDSFVIECAADTTVTALRSQLARARKHRIAVLSVDDSPHSVICAESVTHALARHPGHVEVIWDAHLRPWKHKSNGHYQWGRRSGKPDLLVRDSTVRRAAWIPVDVKHHRVFPGKGKTRKWEVSSISDVNCTRFVEYDGPFHHSDAMQLAHYHRMLEFHGLDGSAWGGVIGKAPDGANPEDHIVWVDLEAKLYQRDTTSALDDYDEAFAEAWEVARGAARGLQLSRVEWKAECNTCAWRGVCRAEAVASGEMTMLPGVTVGAGRRLRAGGVTDISELAHCNVATAELVRSGIDDLTDHIIAARELTRRKRGHLPVSGVVSDADTIAVLARASVHTIGDLAGHDPVTAALPARLDRGVDLVDAIDQARVTDRYRSTSQPHIYRKRGSALPEIPDVPVEIHVDMEEDGLIYMWGARFEHRTGAQLVTTYHCFDNYDGTETGESEVFVAFWEWLQARVTEAEHQYGAGSVKVYHYTAAEDRCLRHLAREHGGRNGAPEIGEIDEFLASDIWVDLYPLLTKTVLWPTENHTLKSLAKYVRFNWREEDPSGATSTIWYRHACDPTLTDTERAGWVARLREYNEDDVQATSELLGFFRRLLAARNPNHKLADVAKLDAHYQR